MPIPDWTAQGLLPPGVHLATLAEIEMRYCWNAHRRGVWQDGMRFLRELIGRNLSYPIYIGGSFTTDKPDPPDLDVVLDLTLADDYHQFLAAGMFRRERSQIKTDYRVDFCPNLPGNNDFSSYFQYVGEKTATIKGLKATDRKGVLRIQAWANGLSK